MFKFVGKSSKILAYEKYCSGIRISTTQKFHFIQLNPLSSSSTQASKNSILNGKIDVPHSFTVDYLIKLCGLSEKTAISAAKNVNFKTPDKPNSVLAVFKKYGFTDAQVSDIISSYPSVLVCRPQKTLLPKIEFFQSAGFSTVDIAKVLSSGGSLLTRSLETQIVPSLNALRDLFTSYQDLVCPIKRCPGILTRSFQSLMLANIEFLRKVGVPEPNILNLLKSQPRLLVRPCDVLKESVEELEKMGLNPQDGCFARCLWRMASIDKKIWREKMALYERWGCSENEVLIAFKKHASVMAISSGKIVDVMDFLVVKMGYDPSAILKAPFIVTLSLKKTIIPRCLVHQALLSKGLLKKNVRLATLLVYPEKIFLKRFVECFEKEAAELLKVYQEKRKGTK
ncbi:unnamed protein product [Coffea canephora]|uniref:Uncharacterized protein n=1 Tax=Coffea canephora TaxID=49390 RepID=A0A068TRE8_COFCA|nr:unnamed protein product [Coffea canephora]